MLKKKLIAIVWSYSIFDGIVKWSTLLTIKNLLTNLLTVCLNANDII